MSDTDKKNAAALLRATLGVSAPRGDGQRRNRSQGFSTFQTMGYVGTDPEPRTTTNGTTVCDFNLLINVVERAGLDAKPHSFRITCFGDTAETVTKYLKKGRHVLVNGVVRQNRYQSRALINANSLAEWAATNTGASKEDLLKFALGADAAGTVYTQQFIGNQVIFLDSNPAKGQSEEQTEPSTQGEPNAQGPDFGDTEMPF